MYKEEVNNILKLFEEILDEFECLDSTGVYYDRRWDQVRETNRIDPEDEKYVRQSDLLELVNRYRSLDIVAQADLNNRPI